MSKKKEKKPKEKEKLLEPVDPKGVCGLLNLGNTCYLNSILQCLLHLPELIDYMKSSKLSEDISINKAINQKLNPEDKAKQELCYKLLAEFNQLLNKIWTGYKENEEQKCNINPRNVLEPSDFKITLSEIFDSFKGNWQQDAHEVLTSILDSFHLALNKTFNEGGLKITSSSYDVNLIVRNTLSCIADASHKAVNDSFIEDTFFGQISTIFSCYQCHKKINETLEDFSFKLMTQESQEFYYFTSTKNFLFSDKYINFESKLTTDKIYGFGERTHDFKLNEGTYTIWSHDCSGTKYDDGGYVKKTKKKKVSH